MSASTLLKEHYMYHFPASKVHHCIKPIDTDTVYADTPVNIFILYYRINTSKIIISKLLYLNFNSK